jgi:HEAT repeat protein
MSRRQEQQRIRDLGGGPYDAVIDELLAALASDDEDIRLAAVEALDDLDDERTITPLARTLRDEEEDPGVRRVALLALGDFGDRVREYVEEAAASRVSDLRNEARSLLRDR